mgnify:CR=1 FL=1
MRQVLTIRGSTTTFKTVVKKARDSSKIRILGVLVTGGIAADGDFVDVQLGFVNVPLFRTSTGAASASVATTSFAIGFTQLQLTTSGIDPVTGAATFIPQFTAQGSLPDVTWDTEVEVRVAGAVLISEWLIVYELIGKENVPGA